jgi:AcrR family transcriptional regulator
MLDPSSFGGSTLCNSTVAEYASTMLPRQGVDDPRVRRSRTAVLGAALAELTERGYGGFTIDGVATRAGVARSTVYRIWGDRSRQIEDALEELNQQPPAGERGSETPRERVEALVRHLSEAMAGSKVADCLPGLVDGAERDPDVRRLHHGYNARRRAALVDAIAEGRSSGAPGFDVDPELAALALAGAVVYRRLMTPQPLTGDEVVPLVETVLRPASKPTPRIRRPARSSEPRSHR